MYVKCVGILYDLYMGICCGLKFNFCLYGVVLKCCVNNVYDLFIFVCLWGMKIVLKYDKFGY